MQKAEARGDTVWGSSVLLDCHAGLEILFKGKHGVSFVRLNEQLDGNPRFILLEMPLGGLVKHGPELFENFFLEPCLLA